MTENQSALGTARRSGRAGAEERTFSLMEVAQETGIAMPILLRYKREHPDRIPSTGSGAQQRFPEAAFAVFEEIHRKESESRDLPRRGGFGLLSLPRLRRSKQEPKEGETAEAASEVQEAQEAAAAAEEAKKTATAEEPAKEMKTAARRPTEEKREEKAAAEPTERARAAEGPTEEPETAEEPAAAAARTTGEANLTLKDISEELGIPYPTIARYATKHEDRIPHEGDGRNRRFPPEAVEVFRRIRKESKPGRPRKSDKRGRKRKRPAGAKAAPSRAVANGELAGRIEQLESRQQELEEMVRELRDQVSKPLTAVVEPF